MSAHTFLATLPLFQGLPENALHDLVVNSSKSSFETGETIVEQNQAANECYVILDGSAQVNWKPSADSSNPLPVATISTGDIFGEIALLDGSTRSADVIALQHTECLVIPKQALQALIQQNHLFSIRMLSLVVTRLWEMERKAGG